MIEQELALTMRKRHTSQYTLRLMHPSGETSMALKTATEMILAQGGVAESDGLNFLIPAGSHPIRARLEPTAKGSRRIGSILLTAKPNMRTATKRLAAKIAVGSPRWVGVDPTAVYPREVHFPTLPGPSAATYLEQAQTALAKGKFADARWKFRLHLSKDTRNAPAWAQLAALYVKSRELKRALFAYGKALAIAPDDRELRGALATVERQVAEAKVKKKKPRK